MISAAYRKMVAAGMSVDDIADMLDILERGFSLPAPPVPDALEKRRAYDRERKRKDRKSGGIPPESAEAQSSNNSTGIPPEFHRTSPPLARVVDITSLTEVSGKKNKKDIPSKDAFDRFWEAYPRKVGKGAACQAFSKALREATPEQIGEALSQACWPDDLQFIPHPATWLNQQRWLDPPQQAPPKRHAFATSKDSLRLVD